MFDMFINLVSDDALADAIISLAENFQCAPIEMLSVGCLFLCVSGLVAGLLVISVLDRLFDKAFFLLEKLAPVLVRFIISTLTAFYLLLRQLLHRPRKPRP